MFKETTPARFISLVALLSAEKPTEALLIDAYRHQYGNIFNLASPTALEDYPPCRAKDLTQMLPDMTRLQMIASGRWLKILSQLGKSADEKADVPYSTGESVVSTHYRRSAHLLFL